MIFSENRVGFQQHLRDKTDAALRQGDAWPVDQHRFPHLNSPERHTLEPVLGIGVSLQQTLVDRRNVGLATNVLELFGSADFLEDPTTADSITGTRLTDTKYKDTNGRQTRPRMSHHVVIPGDIHQAQTMHAIEVNLRNRKIESIDLAVCAPRFGWANWREREFHPSVILDTYYPMLAWTYSLLSHDEGRIVTEIPPRMGLRGNHIRGWAKRMQDSGIPTTVAKGDRSYVAEIIRQPDSPETIAPLQGRCLPLESR